jgi:hypothetical protein
MELDDQLVVQQCMRPTKLPLSLEVVVDVQSLLILCKCRSPNFDSVVRSQLSTSSGSITSEKSGG